jgi:hypothetical protein
MMKAVDAYLHCRSSMTPTSTLFNLPVAAAYDSARWTEAAYDVWQGSNARQRSRAGPRPVDTGRLAREASVLSQALSAPAGVAAQRCRQ